MSPVAELQSAVDDSTHPLITLREKIQEVMAAGGLTTEDMLAMLRELRMRYREAGETRKEDVALDAMDFVGGWCSTHMKVPHIA